MFSLKELSKIKNLLESSTEGVVIISHQNPDGDAIGSSLGLKHGLKNLKIEAKVIVPNDFPKFLKWMPGAKQILIGEFQKNKVKELIHNAKIIFCLDFNTLNRIGILGELVSQSSAIKILIDHHQMPDKFHYTYSDTSIPATSQMIYNFLETLYCKENISQETAKCLYTGIMTDTGGFRFRSTSASTHRIIANLIEKGAEPSQIASDTWDTNSLERMKLLSVVLGRIELVKAEKVAILWLKREEMNIMNNERGATEGFVNYGLSILGVKISVFFVEDLHEDFIKISFRSKDDIDVNNFARKYFNGGGHINAAGGKSEKKLENTINEFKKIIEIEELSI